MQMPDLAITGKAAVGPDEVHEPRHFAVREIPEQLREALEPDLIGLGQDSIEIENNVTVSHGDH